MCCIGQQWQQGLTQPMCPHGAQPPTLTPTSLSVLAGQGESPPLLSAIEMSHFTFFQKEVRARQNAQGPCTSLLSENRMWLAKHTHRRGWAVAAWGVECDSDANSYTQMRRKRVLRGGHGVRASQPTAWRWRDVERKSLANEWQAVHNEKCCLISRRPSEPPPGHPPAHTTANCTTTSHHHCCTTTSLQAMAQFFAQLTTKVASTAKVGIPHCAPWLQDVARDVHTASHCIGLRVPQTCWSHEIHTHSSPPCMHQRLAPAHRPSAKSLESILLRTALRRATSWVAWWWVTATTRIESRLTLQRSLWSSSCVDTLLRASQATQETPHTQKFSNFSSGTTRLCQVCLPAYPRHHQASAHSCCSLSLIGQGTLVYVLHPRLQARHNCIRVCSSCTDTPYYDVAFSQACPRTHCAPVTGLRTLQLRRHVLANAIPLL
jgi:hypothetical protein